MAVEAKFHALTASEQVLLCKGAQCIQCIQELGDNGARVHEDCDHKGDVLLGRDNLQVCLDAMAPRLWEIVIH